MGLKDSFIAKVGGAGLGALALIAPVYAQEAAETPVVAAHVPYYDSVLDAIGDSQAYAKETGGIGVVLGYGAYDGAPSPESVGERFVGAFERRDMKAQYFIVQSDNPGYSVAFSLGKVGYDFMSIDEGVSLLDEVAKSRRDADTITSAANEIEVSSLEVPEATNQN